MNLSELRAEVQARGFNNIEDARIDRWVNLAVNEIAETADWPFLHAEATGPAPLTIADLRTIESVEDTTNAVKLIPADRRDLSDRYPDLTVSGSPVFYFLTAPDTVDVYPRGGSLRVRYWSFPADLSADTDEPVIPARYQYAIVDYAVARAYADSDEFASAQAARLEGDRLILAMTTSLIDAEHDRPARMTMLGGHLDG